MKKLLLLPLIIFGLTANATDRYISTSGNDGNSGASSSPWRTLAYAASHSSSGDLIHVAAGTYVETARVNLPVGVSIIGAGVTSIIQSTYAVTFGDANDAIIKLDSYGSPSTTPQSISYLKIDGRSWTSTNAISILDRSNVTISNCTIINFKIQGIHFGGGTTFSDGDIVHDCIINDCSTRHGESSATASIYLLGTTNFKIYNNSFSQTLRVIGGNNGNIIGGIATYSYGNSGLKIYNNTFTKTSYDNSGFNFSIELWNVSNQCEIYGNTFNNGTVDVCGIRKGSGTYGLDVHDNNFLQPANIANLGWDNSSTGLNLEDANGGSLNGIGVIQYIHIYNNLFQFTGKGITIDATVSDTDTSGHIDHIYVYDNVFDRIGWTNNPGNSIAFHMNGHNQTPIRYDSVEVYNNTFVGNSYSAYGYYWYARGAFASHLKIRNNIFQGWYDNPVYFSPVTGTPTINVISVENNLYYSNGINAGVYSGVTVTNKTEQNNLTTNPLFISSTDYHLQSGSTAINAGINVGLPYSGSAPDIGRHEYGSSGPTANAGPDQIIILPTSVDSLIGSGANGSISSYNWIKIAGPSLGALSNASSATTTVTGLIQGVYKFELKVTDNNGAVGRDTMQLTVNTATIVNIPPTANAGVNQTITLPTNTVALNGSGKDTDGTVAIFFWTKISGPSSGTIVNADSAATTVTGVVQGVYQFELKVTDNNGAVGRDTMQVTVNAAGIVNIPPVANAGPFQTITLPTSTTSLSGSGTDADGSISAYSWAKLSGPLGGIISNATSAATTLTGLVQGVYKFELKVTDNNGAVGRDTMQITVNAAVIVNIPPVANAGLDQTITLPTGTVTLTGSGSDANGTVTGYLWTKISGPSTFNIVNAASPVTDVSGLVQGVYQFELKVTDNSGAVGRDTMQVTVNAAVIVNIAPVANAGLDQTITLPTGTVTLTGSGSDANGTVTGYLWTMISGPSTFNIVNAVSSVTDVSGLVQGVYQFELKVTDNSGAVGRDTMQLTVNAAPKTNKGPIANAGPHKTLTLPSNITTLTGSATSTNGSISSYSWTKISGPSAGTITTANSPVTSVTGLVQGIYQFELKVVDSIGAAGRDTTQVTVNNGANLPPVANAGLDQTITLPISSTSLSGTGTDPDGTITGYSWKQISGPPVGTLVSPNNAVTFLNNLVGGTYNFELSVTDNLGAIGRDTVEVVVAVPRLNLDVQSNNISIYPNPVMDITTLEINTTKANQKLLVVISNMQGSIVYKNELASGQTNIRDKINLSNLSKGTYAVTVYFNIWEKQTLKVLKL